VVHTMPTLSTRTGLNIARKLCDVVRTDVRWRRHAAAALLWPSDFRRRDRGLRTGGLCPMDASHSARHTGFERQVIEAVCLLRTT